MSVPLRSCIKWSQTAAATVNTESRLHMAYKHRLALVVIPILSGFVCFSLMPARAATTAPTFIVNSPADVVAGAPLDNGVCETAPGNGVCTLRAAIMKANH